MAQTQAIALPAPAKKGISAGEVLGSLIFLAGAAGATYFYRFFETTVPTSFGEMNNIGLLADRQNGLMASGAAVVVGIVLAVALRNKK